MRILVKWPSGVTEKTKMTEMQKLLEQMDVPQMRKDLSNPSNVRWLLRNLQVRNNKHPQIGELMKMLRNKR